MKTMQGFFYSLKLKKAAKTDCFFIFMLSTILKKKDSSDRDNR